MGWMILLVKENEVGDGCICCRFRHGQRCMIDKRVDIHDRKNPEEIDKYRPYHCPFRYFDKEIKPITDRFHGMTKEETKGYFMGADHEHKRYVRLEEERSSNVEAWYREAKINAKEKRKGK